MRVVQCARCIVRELLCTSNSIIRMRSYALFGGISHFKAAIVKLGLMSNRTPTRFYGATSRPACRGRRLAAQMTGSLREQDRTYQPNEGLFEREDYALDMYLSDPDEPGDVGDSFSSRNSLDSDSAIRSSVPRQRHSAEAHTPRQGYSPSCSSFSPGIVAMLQEQQGTLQRILKEQQNLSVLVTENEKKVKALEESLKKLNEKSNSSTSSSGEKKTRTVTRDLTVSTRIYLLSPCGLYTLYIYTCMFCVFVA